MHELSMHKLRHVSTLLSQEAESNQVSHDTVARLAKRAGIAAGEVIGIARDLRIEVTGMAEGKAVADDAARRDQGTAGKGRTIPDLVKGQILKGSIYKGIGAGSGDGDFIVTTARKFRKERQAIVAWTTGLEIELREARTRIAELEKRLEEASAPTKVPGRDDPEDFFRDPRDR